jgi:ketosteroid isomerase-like protein
LIALIHDHLVHWHTTVSTTLTSGGPTMRHKYFRVWTLLLSGFVATTIGVPGVAGQQPIRVQVTGVIDAFHAALAMGDSVAALSHLAEDVIILETGGIETKAQYRAGHLAGDMSFAAAVPRERGEMLVTIIGDVAWAHSTSITQGRTGDREINSQGAELVVLAREDGNWKIKAIHWSSRQGR